MNFWEIATLVTGVIYIILEIKQKNFMWVVGILTGVAAFIVFYKKGLYASMLLNAYYVIISFWGLYAWKRDAAKMKKSASAEIHLNKLSMSTCIASMLILLVGTLLFMKVLAYFNDPMSGLDASVTILSAIATFWLSRSYAEQWILWVVADLATAIMCLSQSLPWMFVLYLLYSVVAIYGYIYWIRNGQYVKS